jgi:hypothetical protein
VPPQNILAMVDAVVGAMARDPTGSRKGER